MSLDLSKLPKAPLIAWRYEQQGSAGNPTHGGVTNLDGYSPLVQLDHAVALDADFAESAALTLNALDVQMRRGWYAERRNVAGVDEPPVWRWRLGKVFWDCHEIDEVQNRANTMYDDPATCLVEWDAWWKENVEVKR